MIRPQPRRRGPLPRAAARGALLLAAVVTVLTGAGAAPVAEAQPYLPSGQTITGGDDAGAAVALAPGVYTDTLAQGVAEISDTGSVRYYAIAVQQGQTPYVAVTIGPPDQLPDDGDLGVDVSLTARGETSSCETESKSDFTSDDRLDPVTAVAAPGEIGREGGCPAGTLVVRVERTGDAVIDDPLDIELAYRLEPAVASTSGLPGASGTDAPKLQASLTGTPATLASGNSFDTAPLVGTGIYKDELTAGDTRIVRVRLDWGQRFAYSFAASAQPGVASGDAVSASAAIRNPLRQLAPQASGAQSSAFSVGASDAAMAGSTFAPVRYLNRTSDDDDVTFYANAGDYYLVLATDVPTDGDDTLSYPYSLQIQVFGAAQAQPAYGGTSTGPTASEADDPGGRAGVVVASAAGAAVLVAVVVLVVVLSRRRRRARPGDAETRQVRVHR